MDEVPARVTDISRRIPPRPLPTRRAAVVFFRATLLASASLAFGCGGDATTDAGLDDGALSDADERDADDADRPDADPSDAGLLDGDVPPDGRESCDDGDAMGDAPGACRDGCRFPFCGDGILDPGERCDEGAANGDGAGACRRGAATESSIRSLPQNTRLR